MKQAEALLGAVFPADLRTLFLATDGVFDQPGQWFVVWPLGEVVTRNQRAWAHESAARQELVGFGDDGTGAPFWRAQGWRGRGVRVEANRGAERLACGHGGAVLVWLVQRLDQDVGDCTRRYYLPSSVRDLIDAGYLRPVS